MNEQERSRLIERIVENHLNESERAELLPQLGEGTNVRQELLAEQAISRARAALEARGENMYSPLD